MDNSKIIETLLELTTLVVRKDNEIRQLSEMLATKPIVPPSKPIIFRELFKDEDTVGDGKAFTDPESIQQMVVGLEDFIIKLRTEKMLIEAERDNCKNRIAELEANNESWYDKPQPESATESIE